MIYFLGDIQRYQNNNNHWLKSMMIRPATCPLRSFSTASGSLSIGHFS